MSDAKDNRFYREPQPSSNVLSFLDDQPFYEMMQAYRHAHIVDQAFVVERFEAVKAFIREQYSAVEPCAAPMKMRVDYEWQSQRLERNGEEECAAGGPAPPPRALLSDLADELIRRLHADGMVTMQVVFDGAILRIQPDSSSVTKGAAQ